MTYQAEIRAWNGATIATLGPTDTRDEASRLSRAWLEERANRPRGSATPLHVTEIGGVSIVRVEDEAV